MRAYLEMNFATTFTFSVVSLVYFMVLPPANAQDAGNRTDEVAKALVVAAANERVATSEFHISGILSVDSYAPEYVEFFQKKERRKVVFSQENDERFRAFLMDGVFAWRLHGDLARMSYATGKRRHHFLECTDLRWFGVSSVPSGDDESFTIQGFLLNTLAFRDVGVEMIGNETTHHVELVSDWATRHIWISPSDFRIHRISLRNKYLTFEINLFYEVDRPTSFRWLPSRIVSEQKEHSYTVTDIVLKSTTVPDLEFEYPSLMIPVGKAVDDYDTGVRMGYWNGKSIVEDFPYAEVRRANTKEDSSFPQWAGWVVFIVGVVGIAASWLYFRRR